jgi:hypothetical protein
VDLLPNVIDMVVIGDRLFSLPIQVEGRDDNVETGVHMDLDDGMNDDANADKATEEGDQGNRGKDSQDRAGRSGHEEFQASSAGKTGGISKEVAAGSVASQNSATSAGAVASHGSTGNKRLVEVFRGPSIEQADGMVVGHGSVNKGMCNANIDKESDADKEDTLNKFGGAPIVMQENTSQVSTEVSMNEDVEANILGCKAQLGNSDMIMNQSKGEQMDYNLSKSRGHGIEFNGNVSEARNLVSDLHVGNSVLNFNQEISTEVQAIFNEHAAPTTFAGFSDLEEKVMDKSQETLALIQQYVMPMNTPVKRSKRREGSMDEDSSTIAESVKAKKNLDASGMSEAKSFLSFPNAKIKSTISSLGIVSGDSLDKGIEKVKELEYLRLLDAPSVETTNSFQNTTDDELGSDIDSDFGLDHKAIQQDRWFDTSFKILQMIGLGMMVVR